MVRNGFRADAAGRTVYTFDKDELNKSNCAGGCLAAWPAFVAKAGATPQGDFGLIEAKGSMQWAVKGKPLYYFAAATPSRESATATAAGARGTWWAKMQRNKPHPKPPKAQATPTDPPC